MFVTKVQRAYSLTPFTQLTLRPGDFFECQGKLHLLLGWIADGNTANAICFQGGLAAAPGINITLETEDVESVYKVSPSNIEIIYSLE